MTEISFESTILEVLKNQEKGTQIPLLAPEPETHGTPLALPNRYKSFILLLTRAFNKVLLQVKSKSITNIFHAKHGLFAHLINYHILKMCHKRDRNVTLPHIGLLYILGCSEKNNLNTFFGLL